MILAPDYSGLPDALARLGLRGRAFVLTDRNVGTFHGRRVIRTLKHFGLQVHGAAIPAGERQKSLRRLGWLLDRLLDARIERGDTLFALGGGVVGDLGGFAAACYLRGIALVQLPTSLLAMVDAAIGGKVGVNLPRGKNLAGAFHQPRLVYAAVGALATLPDREFRAGLAEIIKSGMVGDARLIVRLESDMDQVLARRPVPLARAIADAQRVKGRVVAVDEREAGRRAILNYGHTVGHAVESATGYRRFLHGEAVSLGMTVAARLAASLGVCRTRTAERQGELLTRAGLPIAARGLPIPDVIRNLFVDKKVKEGRLRIVLTSRVGSASVREQPVDLQLVRAIHSITTD